MAKPLHLLLVEDSEDDAQLILRELHKIGYEVTWQRVETAGKLVHALTEQTWDLVVCDYSLPQFGAPQALNLFKDSGVDIPFIIVSGTIGEETAVSAMKAGAHDFLIKGNYARLGPAIERELRDAETRRERKLAEDQIRLQLARLLALRRIDEAITSSFDLRLILNTALAQTIEQLQVDAADILLLNEDLHTLEYFTGQGFHTRSMENMRIPLNNSYAGRAVLERRLIQIADLSARPLLSRELSGEGFVCYCGIPLINKGKVNGVLEVFHRAPLQPSAKWLDFFETLAGQAAIAIDNATLFQKLQRSNFELELAYNATIEGWSRALELRDRETEGHTQRVTEMTLNLARALAVPSDHLIHIQRGGLLHDIGKMGVPDGILLKPGPLTERERAVMSQHPQLAFDWLAPITFLQRALEIPYCHHEKWDGTGYPRGLAGEQIPLSARIFAVADVWDALTNDRPYRKAWSRAEAVEYIRAHRGRHFDPRVVDAFLNLSAETEIGKEK